MNYDEFLERLYSDGWERSGPVFYKLEGEAQCSLVRIGGKFQRKGMISFVFCTRLQNMRNREKETNRFEKEPSDYPYKHTLADLSGDFLYKRGGFERSELPRASGWEEAYRLIISNWLPRARSLTRAKVLHDIKQAGGDWYIEQIWKEDLEAT